MTLPPYKPPAKLFSLHKNEFSLRLRKIIAESEKQTEAVAEKYMLQLRVMYLVRMQIPKANSI